MQFSPIRSKLMSFEPTPAKNVVGTDINGWMETNLKKHQQQYKPKSSGRSLFRKLSPKKAVNNENSNLASLKERRLRLLDSGKKVSSLRHIEKSEKTAAQTQRTPEDTFQVCFTKVQNNEPSRTITDFKLKLTQIQVSQFKTHDVKNLRKTIFKKSNQNCPPLLKKNLPRDHHQKQAANSVKHMTELIQKIKSQQGTVPEKRRNKNLVSVNPEMKNMIFKSKKVLSVSNFPIK